MGTQKSIAHQIHTAGADYILSLKSNHPTLFQQVEQWFQQMQADGLTHPTWTHHWVWTSPHRHTHRLDTLGGLVCCPYQADAWAGLQSIVIVERTRRLWNKTTHEVQFYSAVCRRIAPKLPLPFASIGDWKRTALDLRCHLWWRCLSGTLSMHPTIWHCYVALPSMRSIEPAQANKASGRSLSGQQWMIALCCGCWQPHCPTPTKTKILAVNSFWDAPPKKIPLGQIS